MKDAIRDSSLISFLSSSLESMNQSLLRSGGLTTLFVDLNFTKIILFVECSTIKIKFVVPKGQCEKFFNDEIYPTIPVTHRKLQRYCDFTTF